MTEHNFADRYKAAALSPTPEIVDLRKEAVDKILTDIDASKVTDLVRLYYGLDVGGDPEWFRDAFIASDSSFSMIDNAREAAVLSGCILEAGIRNGNVLAALAVLTASVGSTRKPVVSDGLGVFARDALMEISKKERSVDIINPKIIKYPTKSKVPAQIETFLAAPSLPEAGEVMVQINEEWHTAAKTLTSSVFKVVTSLSEQSEGLREEVDMLWWHIGGSSRLIDRSFEELDLGLASALAGMDLADLSRTYAGPVAAPAMLHRTLANGRKKLTDVTIIDAVNALKSDDAAKLELSDAVKSIPDICPVSLAYQKALEIGDPSAWQISFTKASGIDASVAFPPLDFALQVFRERSLLSSFD